MPDLLTDVTGGVATATLNRPEVRNALSSEMRGDLIDALQAWEQDPAVRCVVLKGAGEHFMAGGDVKRFATEYAPMAPEARRGVFLERIHDLHRLMAVLARMPQPVVASVQGAAAGAGLSLALNSDLVLAGESAFFTLAYCHIGASPDGGATWYLPRAVGARKAMELALLGDRVPASEALAMGLINRVVPDAELVSETEALAQRLAAGPTRAYAATRRLIRDSFEHDLPSQLHAEAEAFADTSATEDWVEGVTAFLEKRKPTFKGK